MIVLLEKDLPRDPIGVGHASPRSENMPALHAQRPVDVEVVVSIDLNHDQALREPLRMIPKGL
jgi:hypothetical protein